MSKISNLTELVTPAQDDIFVVVDVNDNTMAPTGTTKFIQKQNMFDAGDVGAYTTTEVDNLLASYYLQTQVDALLTNKAIVVDEANDLLTADTSLLVITKSYVINKNLGAGKYYYDSSIPRTQADGGLFIDPTVPLTLEHTTEGTGADQGTGVGTGCWVRILDDMSSVYPEWWGCIYAGIGSDEWRQVQACFNGAVLLHQLSPQHPNGAPYPITITDEVRVSKSLSVTSALIQGTGAMFQCGIIYNGGVANASGYLIETGGQSNGGMRDIILKSFDSLAGQTKADAKEGYYRTLALGTTVLADLSVIWSKVNFFGEVSGTTCIMLDGTGSTGAGVVGLTFNEVFGSGGRGSFLTVIGGNGGNRHINFIGGTNVQLNSGEIDVLPMLDLEQSGSHHVVNFFGYRPEYKGAYSQYFAIVRFGNAGGIVNTLGFSGIQDNEITGVPFIWAKNKGDVKTFGTPSGPIFYESGETPEQSGGLNGGQQFAVASVGARNLGTFQNSDRNQSPGFYLNVGDQFICRNPDECDRYIVEANSASIVDYPDGIYTSTLGNITRIGSADVTAFDNTFVLNTVIAQGIEKLVVKINGAGAGGTDLITQIVDFNASTGVYTIDAANGIETSVVDVDINIVSASFKKVFDKPRNSEPTVITGGDEGATYYSIEVTNGRIDHCYKTWSSDRWIYGQGFACTTANRPVYSTNVKYEGKTVFDLTLNKPIWWEITSGVGRWRLADGTDVT